MSTKQSADALPTYGKPSQLLSEGMDSHDVCDVAILERCMFDTSSVPRYTIRQTIRAMRARGLGGAIDESDLNAKVVWGWTAALALSKQYTGKDSGAPYHGRGSMYRAALDDLKRAGF